jgi:hypothetical protein
MRLPPKKRPGNPILASDWNALIDALAARTPRPSSGMELTFSSGGFAYRAQKPPSSNAPPSCGSFRVFTRIDDGQTKPTLIVGEGTAGKDAISETDLGSLASNYGMKIYLQVTFDGSDGTYESEVIAQPDEAQSDDETIYFLIGTVNDEGGITQNACGPISILVCRNWFAAEAPFYGITVSA